MCWNSWYIMLKWVIEWIKPFLQIFINNDSDLSDNILTVNDWGTFISMQNFLKLFYQITKYTESWHATINKVLSSLDFLLDRYDRAQLYAFNNFMKLAIDVSWKKLKNY